MTQKSNKIGETPLSAKEQKVIDLMLNPDTGVYEIAKIEPKAAPEAERPQVVVSEPINVADYAKPVCLLIMLVMICAYLPEILAWFEWLFAAIVSFFKKLIQVLFYCFVAVFGLFCGMMLLSAMWSNRRSFDSAPPNQSQAQGQQQGFEFHFKSGQSQGQNQNKV